MAIAFAAGGLTIGRLVRPDIPGVDKSVTYECGERPIGKAWFNFNPRFYLIALVFVVFEVDIALTFPVVAVYKAWVGKSSLTAWIAFAELLLFTVILVVGLVWVWIHGDLEWVKKFEADERPSLRSPSGPDDGPRRAA
ncbi:NADH-quinone oxidoreductase subunit A [Anaeromyxobacter paludicola]|uniref:NADH-quinone oxidoreductase subunit A n=1 Tax=Anaeromyxobacter paludicola TaxID=2918171 RepID=UPI0020BEF2C8|nr:NADH-quinone oxidoreductase subunit A [Anaeromyxobacter paludicola]